MNSTRFSRLPRSNGSALVVVMLTVAVLTLAGAAMLNMASARFRNTMQASG